VLLRQLPPCECQCFLHGGGPLPFVACVCRCVAFPVSMWPTHAHILHVGFWVLLCMGISCIVGKTCTQHHAGLWKPWVLQGCTERVTLSCAGYWVLYRLKLCLRTWHGWLGLLTTILWLSLSSLVPQPGCSAAIAAMTNSAWYCSLGLSLSHRCLRWRSICSLSCSCGSFSCRCFDTQLKVLSVLHVAEGSESSACRCLNWPRSSAPRPTDEHSC
jgi:hypothetical protein